MEMAMVVMNQVIHGYGDNGIDYFSQVEIRQSIKKLKLIIQGHKTVSRQRDRAFAFNVWSVLGR